MNIITTGLPYSNGTLHIGHIYEWLLADCLTRINPPSVWVSGDDSHGVAVLQSANKNNIDPKTWVNEIALERKLVLNNLGLPSKNYLSTQESFHHDFVKEIYFNLKNKGYLVEKECLQYFDDKNNPLFERDVQGLCPDCNTLNYLGSCENCLRSLEPGDLVSPICTKTQKKVYIKKVKLIHFDWGRTRNEVLDWVGNQSFNEGLKKKIIFDANQLPDLWCIERIGEYFGVRIPDKDNFFYVWFEALLGYYSFAKHLDYSGEFIHVIGKDITTFHALRLIGLCIALDWPKPKLFIHGFVVDDNNAKLAKSKGNAKNINEILKDFDVDLLRYYFCQNTNGINDIPFSESALLNCQTKLANLFGNTYRRLYVLASGKIENIESKEFLIWQQSKASIIDNCDIKSWVEQGEKLLHKINEDISSLKLWEKNDSLEAKQLFGLLTEILKEFYCLLPEKLGNFVRDIENNSLTKDSVFFENRK